MVTREELEKMSPEEIADMQKVNCIFCKIVSGEVPSQKIFDNFSTVALMDINPGVKGHVLVMPKEHFPILPVIPPEVFKQLFVDAKVIAQAIKEAMLVTTTTVFVANGAVAGQQAQHFLFHILPRESGDGLNNFDLKVNPALVAEQEQLLPALKQNMPLMMQQHFKRLGGAPFKQKADVKEAQEQALGDMEKRREQIAKIIQDNPDARNLLRDNPDEFRKLVASNEEMKAVFDGVDIDSLSANLKSLPDKQFSVEQKGAHEPEQSTVQQLTQDKVPPQVSKEILQTKTPPSQSIPNKSSEQAPLSVQQEVPFQSPIQTKPVEVVSQPEPSQSSQPIFGGLDPAATKKRVIDYFTEKPQAKELFVNNLHKFKEILSTRPDVQQIFADVDVDGLSVALRGDD